MLHIIIDVIAVYIWLQFVVMWCTFWLGLLALGFAGVAWLIRGLYRFAMGH